MLARSIRSVGPIRQRRVAGIAAAGCVWLLWLPLVGTGQDRLVLRDLTVIETDSCQFDENRVSTAEGQRFEWDQLHSAVLQPERQQEFDAMLARRGIPLFRIRHRLLLHDWEALGEVVERSYRELRQEPLSPENARRHYLVCLATFCHRLYLSPEATVLPPFFSLCDIRKKYPAVIDEFQSHNFTDREYESQFCERVLPIWFDSDVAKTLSELLSLESWGELASIPTGRLLYQASLLVHASSRREYDRIVSELRRRADSLVSVWLPLIEADRETVEGDPGPALRALRAHLNQLDGSSRFTAQYIISRPPLLHLDDADATILSLLSVPAEVAEDHPRLSAAALYVAAEKAALAGRNDEAQIMRTELYQRFQTTYHGRLAKQQ